MNREQVRLWESQCIQEQAPACATGCPMHVDARKIADCVRKGDFRGGFAALASALPLPSILAHICDHPCQRQCKRAEVGDSVRIHLLEKSCAAFGSATLARRFSTQKTQSVLVVGGELSGISAAVLLAQRGYKVTLREPGPALLASLRGLGEAFLPQTAIAADLETLSALEVDIACNQHLPASKNLDDQAQLRSNFDAIFFEARTGLSTPPEDPRTLATSVEGIFAGSSRQELSPIFSVYEGSVAAISIDRFLQRASLTANRDNQGPCTSRLFVNTKNYTPMPAVEPRDTVSGYTREEAQQEASRCFPCQCLECVKACEYLQQYGSYPKRYVREIYNNECIVMGVRKANRMINSCALCGLCASVCPEKLSMADVILEARRGLVASGKMPASAHEFAVRHMEFSTGDAFSLARHQPGFDSSSVAFMPGCQLSGSMPEHVESSYRHLSSNIDGGVGLILGCCGAPALWAGDEARFRDALNKLVGAWQLLGCPTLITACSSCYRTLREHCPEIRVDSLWRHLDAAVPVSTPAPRSMALHDPCSTRNFPEVEQSARGLLGRAGVAAEELNEPGLTTCCGFGGLVEFANRDVADKTIKRRAAQSAADYVTYCAMCRDRFARHNKRAIHILDLVFPVPLKDPAARPDPGFSQRQENRGRLKTRLLREFWGEEKEMDQPLTVEIRDDIGKLLEDRMILVDDLRAVVKHAEETGEKLRETSTGHFLASWRPSCVTYWVEYSPAVSGFIVHNAYSHRMQVK